MDENDENYKMIEIAALERVPNILSLMEVIQKSSSSQLPFWRGYWDINYQPQLVPTVFLNHQQYVIVPWRVLGGSSQLVSG